MTAVLWCQRFFYTAPFLVLRLTQQTMAEVTYLFYYFIMILFIYLFIYLHITVWTKTLIRLWVQRLICAFVVCCRFSCEQNKFWLVAGTDKGYFLFSKIYPIVWDLAKWAGNRIKVLIKIFKPFLCGSNLDSKQLSICFAFISIIKNNFGYFPCAPFLWRERRKLSCSRYFDHLQIRITIVFRYAYVRWIFLHFLD